VSLRTLSFAAVPSSVSLGALEADMASIGLPFCASKSALVGT
jgi:hypothetical protein